MTIKVEDIKQTVILNASIEKVWETVSTAEGITLWFMPNDFKLEVGHKFTVQSPFGPSPCEVLEIDEPHFLSFAWDTEGWIVRFELKEVGEGTEFTLIHTGWKDADETISKASENSAVIRNRMNGGWQMIVHEKLKKAVEG